MSCSLCSLELPKNPIKEGDHAFCCSGCLTVFTIIGRQEDYRNHSLFQEALKAGVIANPNLIYPEQKQPSNEASVRFHLQIENLWCPSCADAIRMILTRQQGIISCVVDYATDIAVIAINPYLLSKEQVVGFIEKLGYHASELLSQEKREISRALNCRFGVAVFCAMNIMMFSYPLYAAYFGVATEGYDMPLGWLSFLLTLPLVTYAAWPIWKRLVVALKSGLFGMETLVFIGVMTAFFLSTFNLLCKDYVHLYFDSMAMVVCFVLLGKILEKRAKFSAKDTFLRLTRHLPNKACKRLESGEYIYVPIKEISCGDLIFVRTGEKIILDGEVIEGEGIVDEAIMTGESVPLQKTKGDLLVGGSIVKLGSLTMQVTKQGSSSLLGQIIALIEQDLMRKNSTDNFVNKITSYFVPAVLLFALVSLFFFGPIRALTLLLISCPCSLGIAAPLVQSRLIFRFAQLGAFVRSRNRLSVLGQDPFFVFDKTGTLTEGKYRVLRGMDHLSTLDSAILKALSIKSKHPVCAAISEALAHISHTLIMDNVHEVVGRGLTGVYLGQVYLLGSERFLRERGVSVEHDFDASHTVDAKTDEKLFEELTTVVYFARNQTLLTEIHLGDRLRDFVPILKGAILSGDSPRLVERITQKLGFLWGKGAMDPLQKREEILNLKKEGYPIVMVGDGVNDAPAMAAADLGISVVSATDMAVEVSDILLTTERLDALPKLCSLSKKCQKIIYQNLFWAFFYNSVAIVCAFLGFFNPLLAALAMVISSLFVIYNSYRI